MNHLQHKFYITLVVFVLMVTAITIAAQFADFSFGVLNIALQLVNSLLLLIIIGNLFHVKENLEKKRKLK